jgi:hypothetical protein
VDLDLIEESGGDAGATGRRRLSVSLDGAVLANTSATTRTGRGRLWLNSVRAARCLEAPWKRQPPRSDPESVHRSGEIWPSGDICRDRTRSRRQLPLVDKGGVPGSSPGSPTNRRVPESPATAGLSVSVARP